MKNLFIFVVLVIASLPTAFAITINVQNNAVLKGQKSAMAEFGFTYFDNGAYFTIPRAETKLSVLDNPAKTIKQIQTVFTVPPKFSNRFKLTYFFFNIYDKDKNYLGVAKCPVSNEVITQNIFYVINFDPKATFKLSCKLR